MIRLALIFFLFIHLPSHANNNDDKLIISKIEDYWNQIESMSGDFYQTDNEGNIATGKFYFLKPYKSKFIYDNKEEDIITNESLLVIVDKKGFKIDSYLIGDNVIKKLLSKNIKINDDFKVDFIAETNFNYEIASSLKSQNAGSKTKLIFDKETLELKKWEIFDEFDNKTVLEFTKIKKNIFISENLFVVGYID